MNKCYLIREDGIVGPFTVSHEVLRGLCDQGLIDEVPSEHGGHAWKPRGDGQFVFTAPDGGPPRSVRISREREEEPWEIEGIDDDA